MITFTFYDPELNKLDSHHVNTYDHGKAMEIVNEHMRTKTSWFFKDVEARSHMWASNPYKPNAYLWMALPEGINARLWIGLTP